MKFRKVMYAPMLQAAADGDWELATSIQITPSDFEGDHEHDGVVTARPHATGWFVSARCRAGLDGPELARFKAFAARNAYLLLQEGPRSGAWAPGATHEQWQAYSGAPAAHAEEHAPEIVPSQWSSSRAA